VDRVRELEAEVAPVLALLDGARGECDQIVGQARRDADGIVSAARGEAAAIGADGDQRASAARDAAARRLTSAAVTDATAMVAAAQREADRIRTLTGQRMPAMVGLALGEIRQFLLAADHADGDR
jgi:vacuolar-type H+-ATPase subunit H